MKDSQIKQGRKRPLDTPKRMIERRERKEEGEIKRGRERERVKERGIEHFKAQRKVDNKNYDAITI